MGLATAIGSSDLHYENFVVAAGRPVLIDHETIMSLGSAGIHETSAAARKAWRLFETSVLATGSIPIWRTGPAGSEWSTNAVGWQEINARASLAPHFTNVNSDSMDVSRGDSPNRQQTNVAITSQSPMAWELLKTGLADGLHRATKHSSDLHDIVATLRDIEVRVVVRDTRYYAELLNRGYFPQYSHDVLDRSLLFDRLARQMLTENRRPKDWGIVRAEHDAMLRGDIPKFATKASDTAIRECGSLESRSIRLQALAPLARAQRSLAEVTKIGKIDRERSFLQSALECHRWPSDTGATDPPRETLGRVARPSRHPAEHDSLHTAMGVVDDLYRMSVKGHDGTLALYGAHISRMGSGQDFSVCDTSDIYYGIAASASFLPQSSKGRQSVDIRISQFGWRTHYYGRPRIMRPMLEMV